MISLKKIKDLAIAHNKFNFVKDIKKNIDYELWVNYIDNNSEIFIWAENTEKGRKNLADIDNVPETFKERVLIAHNKHRCFVDFNAKKGEYGIAISYYDEKIGINFARNPNLGDLKLLLNMANYLDALLLKDGTKIIDEKVIEELSE